jgi:hypothetical protein
MLQPAKPFSVAHVILLKLTVADANADAKR